jgi:lipopolysaccharide transport system ATP-binding protein
MYVKLAFSVAAHLDSEIMVMDEVLAVGDMKFQQKCLGRMGDAANEEGRTVLYVSHNMNTIRQLCTRCLVLDHGKIVFDGDVEQAIQIYMNRNELNSLTDIDLSEKRMKHLPPDGAAKMMHLKLTDKETAAYASGEKIRFALRVKINSDIQDLRFRYEVRYADDSPVGTSQCPPLGDYKKGENVCFEMLFDTKGLTRGKYKCLFVLFGMNDYGTYEDYDAIWPAFSFEIEDSNKINWNTNMWGHIQFPDIVVE